MGYIKTVDYYLGRQEYYDNLAKEAKRKGNHYKAALNRKKALQMFDKALEKGTGRIQRSHE